MIDLLIRHPFVDVCKFGFCNCHFFVVVFVYVYMEVADFSVMFICWDSVEPVSYGVCDVYVRCEGWFGLVWVVPIEAMMIWRIRLSKPS